MTNISTLAPQQLLEEAYKLIAKDRARLGGMNYSTYPAKTAPAMSTLTQRAREYQDKFAQKPAPYANKINRVLGKSNEALPQGNIQDLLNQMRQSQEGSNENLMGQLRNQFRTSYTPEREESQRNTAAQDIGRGNQELSGRLQDINRTASNLEGTKNLQTAKTLQNLQSGKQLRQQTVVHNLDQFGNQKHTYGNKVIAADKARFNEEVNDPQRRLQMLTEALEPHRKNFGGDSQIHPDLEKPASEEMIKALRAYGIDTSKPTEQWGIARTEPTKYTGQMVANLTPKMQSSYNLLERISPSFKGSQHAQQKEITRGLVGDETIARKALRNVPTAMQGKASQLEEDARQRMQKDLTAINNKYIKLGQYGSQQHMSEAELRAQEINKSMSNQRNNYLDESLRNQIAMQHEGEIGNIQKLNVLGEAAHSEFGNALNDIRGLNKIGSNEWKNEQGDLDQLYKNYQNERLWEWPHMRNSVRGEAHDEILGNAAVRGLGIDELANLNSRYSELQRELQNTNQNYAGERNRFNAELATERNYRTAAERERLGRENEERVRRETAERDRQRQASEATQRQAEAQRAAALQAQLQAAANAQQAQLREDQALGARWNNGRMGFLTESDYNAKKNNNFGGEGLAEWRRFENQYSNMMRRTGRSMW